MFCPGCGTQNELKQAFCRQCGQALSTVRLALEGSADQSLEKLKAGRERINAGGATLIIFTLIGLVLTTIGFASGNPILSNSAIINLLLGPVIGLPLIYAGKSSLKQAARLLLKPQTEPDRPEIGPARRPDKWLTTGLQADLHRIPIQESVTEHTTLELKEGERAHRNPIP